jgi:hypothetical protein
MAATRPPIAPKPTPVCLGPWFRLLDVELAAAVPEAEVTVALAAVMEADEVPDGAAVDAQVTALGTETPWAVQI